MAIGTKFQTRLTPADVQRVRDCVSLLADCRQACELAAEHLNSVRGFSSEHDKINNSSLALKHEIDLVDQRLKELLAAGKRSGGCRACGCELSGGTCEFCGLQIA